VPVAFLASSLLLVLTTSAMGRLAARRPQIPLLARTLFMLALGLIPLWLLVQANVRSVFAALVILSKQVESIAVLVFWVALGGMLHARQAKRLYAPIVAGGTLGEIVGSFTSGVIGHTLGIATLLPIAGVALAVAGVLALRVGAAMPVRFGRVRHRPPADAPGPLGLLIPLWRDSRLFRLLSISALLCGALGPMLYFQFAYMADQATRGELQLLSLYAAVRGGLNVLVLLLQLVGTSRLFLRLGVPLASSLSPVVYLAGFLGLSVRVGLDSAIGAMATANLQDHAVYDPAQRVLVTLFPERQRPAATTLIEGPVQRAGSVLGNLIVLATIAVGTPAAVALVGVPIAALWGAAAFVLWRIYPTLLLEVATTRHLHVEEGVALYELLDPATHRSLIASLTDGDPERFRTACQLVATAPLPRAVTTLARGARRASPVNRPLLLETLHRVLDREDTGPAIVPAAAGQLEPLLEQPDHLSDDERTGLVAAYARLAADVRPGSRAADLLERFRNDPAEAVRLAATARLSRARALEADRDDIDAVLRRALGSDDPTTRHVALDEMRTVLLTPGAGPHGNGGAERWPQRIAALAARLPEPRDRVRAAEVLADVAARYGAEAVAADVLLPYAADEDPQVRAAVLRFVGHANLEGQIGWAVERLASSDEDESAAAAAALRTFGRVAINPLIDGLHRGRRAIRQAVLPILRDLQVDAVTLQVMIERQIERMQHLRLQVDALNTGQLSELVLQRLRERVDERAQTVLLLFATLSNEDRFAVLGRLLGRSPHGRGRAVLLEALEALLPPDERTRLMPLLDEDDAVAVQAAATARGRKPLTLAEAIGEVRTDADPLTLSFLDASLDPHALAATRNPEDTAQDADAEPHEMLSRVEICLHLRSLDLFAGLTTRQLSEIASVVHEETVPMGTAIVREGDFGDCMYLIVSGEVEISREGQYKVNAGPGELFGEMSLFDGETRMATVTAVRRTRLLRLDRQALFELMDEQPSIAIGICQTLSRHVRDSIMRLESRQREKDESSS